MSNNGIPEFVKLLGDSIDIHIKKNSDYASETNRFDNFERAAELSSWFDDPVDKVFATMIGIKLARLATITKKGTTNFESARDTFMDMITYQGLWGAYRESKSSKAEKIGGNPRPLNSFQCKQCGKGISVEVAMTFRWMSRSILGGETYYYFCSPTCVKWYELNLTQGNILESESPKNVKD